VTTPRPLLSTYRLQLTPDFGFDDAAATVPYLARLGVSHLYLSPIFEARPGSTHGYDQTDPTRIRAALGGEPAFDRLVNAAHAANLGIVIDIVPNHMAAHHDNPWWTGLLAGGPGSTFDRFFDVDWSRNNGKLVLPVLGAPPAEVIAKGELTTARTPAGAPCLKYYDRLLPLRTGTTIGTEPLSAAELTDLLSHQHYELAFWREGLKRINYRRFFDIADLAGLRIEDHTVFDQMHAKVIDLASSARIDGVRIDHIDGLADPRQYLTRLRNALDSASSSRLPIFVEKIFAHGETLPDQWPIDGATGYAFLATAAALAVNNEGLAQLRRHALSTGAAPADFPTLARDCKREVATSILEPELSRLCRAIQACLTAAGITLDPAHTRHAAIDLSACLGAYRTYTDDEGTPAADALRIRAAAQTAATGANPPPPAALAALIDLFTLAGPFANAQHRAAAIACARLWQQFTGPLAAKGIEDTALYRDTACPALNDVGTEPVAVDAPAQLQHLAASRHVYPLAMNATDTHDAKRSEDARARLAALSHNPPAWTALLDDALPTLTAAYSGTAGPPPAPSDLSLILHSAFARWPLDANPSPALAERLKAYTVKASREAKLATRWTRPDEAYEKACAHAIDRLLFSPHFQPLRLRIEAFARLSRPRAARTAIAIATLKTLFPGTPDFYQGSECQTLSLVDPDNRRPVNFDAHRALLDDILRRWSADPSAAAARLLSNPDTNTAKLFATWRALTIRRHLLTHAPHLTLDSFTQTHDLWRWTIAAGTLRCSATFHLRSDLPAPAPDDSSTGINQLALAPEDAHPWAAITLQGHEALLPHAN